MNLFVLFGDGAITWKKKNDGMHNNAVFHNFFFSGDTPSPNKNNKFIR